MWLSEIGQVLAAKYDPLGYEVCTEEASYWVIRLAGLFYEEAHSVAKYWGEEFKVDNKRSREILGITYRPGSESFLEMAEAMRNTGIIPPPEQYL